jgi:hypothetical protein
LKVGGESTRIVSGTQYNWIKGFKIKSELAPLQKKKKNKKKKNNWIKAHAPKYFVLSEPQAIFFKLPMGFS